MGRSFFLFASKVNDQSGAAALAQLRHLKRRTVTWNKMRSSMGSMVAVSSSIVHVLSYPFEALGIYRLVRRFPAFTQPNQPSYANFTRLAPICWNGEIGRKLQQLPLAGGGRPADWSPCSIMPASSIDNSRRARIVLYQPGYRTARHFGMIRVTSSAWSSVPK